MICQMTVVDVTLVSAGCWVKCYIENVTLTGVDMATDREEPRYTRAAKHYNESRIPWRPFKWVIQIPRDMKTPDLESALVEMEIQLHEIMAEGYE